MPALRRPSVGTTASRRTSPALLSLGSLLTQPVGSAAATAAGYGAPFPGFSGPVAQSLRPYPQYLNVENRSNPNGNSTYHAFQLKAEKRMSGGLTLLTSYTWAKTISDGGIMAGGGPSGQTFSNRRLDAQRHPPVPGRPPDRPHCQ